MNNQGYRSEYYANHGKVLCNKRSLASERTQAVKFVHPFITGNCFRDRPWAYWSDGHGIMVGNH